MSLLDDIRKDRDAGTQGPWRVRYEGGCTHLDMLSHPDMQSQMCDETYYPWVPDNLTDWDRIARVPQMEAALLAADELNDAVMNLAAWQQYDSSSAAFRSATPPTPDGCTDDAKGRLEAALTAYRNAIGDV